MEEALARAVRESAEGVLGDRLVSLVVFGSFARGEEREASDIDVLAVVDGPLPARLLDRDRLFEEARFGFLLRNGRVLSTLLLTREELDDALEGGSPLFQGMLAGHETLVDRGGEFERRFALFGRCNRSDRGTIVRRGRTWRICELARG